MPASIGSFTLTFGLVAIPVQLVPATRSHKIAFRQVHIEDMGLVRNRKTCEVDGQKLDQGEIGRAWEAPDGRLVPLSDAELDDMPLPTSRTIEISGFIDLSAVPPEQFDTPYFLTPSSAAAKKPYVLMREALERSGKAAVGKYALRGSGEALGLIYAMGEVLVVHRLHWPSEIRAAGDAAPRRDIVLDDDELAAALEYIEAVGDIDMQAMRDQYAEAVRELVEAKVAHHAPPKVARRPAASTDVTDLMTALRQAADKARAARGEDADVHHMAGRTAKKTARKRPAKRAPAKKGAAKKSAGKRAG